MRYSTIKYFIKEGLISLFRNRLMSIASIGTVASCILIISLTFCIATNLDYILEQFENSIGITVILDGDATDSDVNRIGSVIKELDQVDTVIYISPDEALKDVEESWGLKLYGLEDDNPLSKTFEVTFTDINRQEEAIEAIEKIDGVTHVNHVLSQAEQLVAINNGLRIASLIVIVVLAMMSVIIITNTIKISVHARKNEINIMKYVGATDWFIRWPFVVEGILMGLVGASIPLLFSWLLYNRAVLYIESIEFFQNLITFKENEEVFAILLPVCLASGMGLGAIGSTLSIRRYLNV